MSFNKKLFVLLLALSPVTALGEEMLSQAEIQAQLDKLTTLTMTVPSSRVEREEELRRLEHVKQRMAVAAEIETSIAQIVELRDKADKESPRAASSVGFSIEEQVRSAMEKKGLIGGAKAEGDSSNAPTPVKSTSAAFTPSIALISIWGNAKNPTADVTINGRPAELSKGSMINGWQVTSVTGEYLTVNRGKTNAKVFYQNPTN